MYFAPQTAMGGGVEGFFFKLMHLQSCWQSLNCCQSTPVKKIYNNFSKIRGGLYARGLLIKIGIRLFKIFFVEKRIKSPDFHALLHYVKFLTDIWQWKMHFSMNKWFIQWPLVSSDVLIRSRCTYKALLISE